MNDRQRAWKDAEEDYKTEQAAAGLKLWRLFWTLVFLSGSGGGIYYAISNMFRAIDNH